MRLGMGTAIMALTVLAAVSAPVAGQEARQGAATTKGAQGALIEVQNNFEEPVTVFMERGQFDRRLGAVAPLATDTIELPPRLASAHDEIALFVVRKNGEELATQVFPLRRGERIGLIVPTPPPAKNVIYAPLPAEEVSKTTLTVENRERKDVVVYAGEGEFQLRLGTVRSDSTATLEFPAAVVGPDNTLTIWVERRGEFALESYPLTLRQGEHLGLRLEPKSKQRHGG